MAYLIDANVLIQAKNAHYRFTFCPAFWSWLVDANSKKEVYLIPQVIDEINKGKDQLKNWCSVNPSLRMSPPPGLGSSLSAVSQWVTSQTYDQNAINTFLGVADYYLVAFAHCTGDTIITHEVSGQNSSKRVKIPEPCSALGISYLSPYAMLENQGAKFVL